MKKNIILIAALSTTFAYAMETNSLLAITKNSLSMLSHGTKINVIKESIFDPSSPMDITVVGYNQQNMLIRYSQSLEMGETQSLICSIIFENNKDDDSASDDDTYKPYPICEKKIKMGHHRLIKSKILTIAEPCISQLCEPNTEANPIKIFTYILNRKRHYGSFYQPLPLQFFGDEAIQEASNDLAICYINILAKGLKILELTSPISIAIPTLSADTGFPRELAAPIAITAVLEWVKDNPEKWDLINNKALQYDTINFIVNKRSDFALYKKLLMQRCNGVYNICLLSWAHKDSELLLSCLPREIINHIKWFMFG